MKVLYSAILVALLASCGGGGHHTTHHDTPGPSPSPQSTWFIGPIVNGKNYSEGMPAYPTSVGSGWRINFPTQGGVDAVIHKGTLAGTAVTVHYSVTGSGFLASGESNIPGRVGVSLQRRGDNWSGAGKYREYRLYSQARPLLIAGNNQQLTVTTWIDVGGNIVDQTVVDEVLANLDNYSIVFGGSFASHGVYVTQPSTFTLESLQAQ